jgi:release factor glutamine methyltransferase
MKQISAMLEDNGIEDAAAEAELLLAEALHISKARLYTDNQEIPEAVAAQIDACVARRTQGEPLQYIIGYIEFYGLKINVGRGVLIPRPETELLVEKAIKRIKEETEKRRIGEAEKSGVTDSLRFLDLCTGSGCIALALAKHFSDADVYGIDQSEAALVYATQNALDNGIRNIHFKLGDLFEPVRPLHFDCIISNPPYIKRDEIMTLQREVKDYEPLEALDGGPDGLDFYRNILRQAPTYLKENGIILLEMGFDQARDIGAIAVKAGLRDIEVIKDYAGIERIFVGRRH